MKPRRHSTESGQTLVLLVLGMVALLGFTALAIDGGMVYSDRRHAQNAADASSLAGGAAAAAYLENYGVIYEEWQNCSNSYIYYAQGQAITAAINRAGDNGFTIDNNIGDNHGTTVTCGNVDNGSWVDRYLDIHTLITGETKTAFAHFVYRGPLMNSVKAVTRVRPRSPLGFGYAIVSLSDSCSGNDSGVDITGTSGTLVAGGGIFSNSCIKASGTVDVDVIGGSITCTGPGCYTSSGGPSISPAPREGSQRMPPDAVAIQAPDCSSLPNRSSPNGNAILDPGKYHSQVKVNNGKVVVLNPGLYCFYNGLTVNGGGTLAGTGVTLYFAGGDFSSNGGATVNLVAPPSENCLASICPPAIPGVLIYMAQDNPGIVVLTGNSYSDYVGTVYAPTGDIEVGGTAESHNFHSQLIGWYVKLHGTSDLDITFDQQTNHQRPALMELYK